MGFGRSTIQGNLCPFLAVLKAVTLLFKGSTIDSIPDSAFLEIMPEDPRGPNPIKLKKPFKLNPECLWNVKKEMAYAVEIFMDHLDFNLLPWDQEDPETGKKKEITVYDQNIIRKMYKLKHMFDKMNQNSNQRTL